MGVRAPDGGHAPVEIVAEGELFARGLGVEVHERERGLLAAGEKPVGGRKRVLGVEVEVTAADEVHHADLHAAAVVHAPAAAGDAVCEVRGAQDIGAVVEVVGDLHAPPCVVAEGDDVGAGGEEILRLLGR